MNLPQYELFRVFEWMIYLIPDGFHDKFFKVFTYLDHKIFINKGDIPLQVVLSHWNSKTSR